MRRTNTVIAAAQHAHKRIGTTTAAAMLPGLRLPGESELSDDDGTPREEEDCVRVVDCTKTAGCENDDDLAPDSVPLNEDVCVGLNVFVCVWV